MKKPREMIKIYALIIIVVSLMLRCSNKESAKESDDISLYKSVYSDYKDSIGIDSIYYFLKNVNVDNQVEELLVFNRKSKKLIEYVFYNIVLAQPRYSIMYDSNLNVIAQDGDPLYITSTQVGRSIYLNDTISFMVHLATPPTLNAEMTIYFVDSTNRFIERSHRMVKDDYSILYKGLVDSAYLRSSRFAIVFDLSGGGFVRRDTSYFNVGNLNSDSAGLSH